MLNYVQKLIQIWGNDALKLFIIKIGTCLNLILDALGMGLKAPLAICVKDEYTAEAVFSELAGFDPPKMIPLGLPKKEFEDKITNVDYELLPIFCNSTSERNSGNLETVANAMISTKIKDNIFCNLPIVAFRENIPLELAEHFSGKCVIDGKKMDGLANNEEIARNLIKAFLENMPLIEHKLQNLDWSDANEGFLEGAGEVCKVLIEREQGVDADMRLKLIQDIEQTVKDLKEEWEITNDYSMWLDLLRDIILEEAKYLTGIINRRVVSRTEVLFLEQWPMFDDDFYFFTTEFFSKMCKKIPYVKEIELKRAMYDAGILVGEGEHRIYYEVKVPITYDSGVRTSKRRLRIVRSWLDLPGQLSWKDLVEAHLRRKS